MIRWVVIHIISKTGALCLLFISFASVKYMFMSEKSNSTWFIWASQRYSMQDMALPIDKLFETWIRILYIDLQCHFLTHRIIWKTIFFVGIKNLWSHSRCRIWSSHNPRLSRQPRKNDSLSVTHKGHDMYIMFNFYRN